MASHQVIDADGHVMEVKPGAIDWERELAPEYRAMAPKTLPFETGGGRILLEGKIFARPYWKGTAKSPKDQFQIHADRRGMWDPQKRLPDMDLDGIDVAVLFGGALDAGIPAIQHTGLAADIARVVNNWKASYASANPERLKISCTMALQDTESAVSEIHRGVSDLGAVAVRLPTQSPGRTLDNPLFEPIWAACEELGVPACIHASVMNPGMLAPGTEDLDLRYYVNLVGFPFSMMRATAFLISSGAFDRHPRLKFAFLEGNCGWVPFWFDRMDEHYHQLGYQIEAKALPSEYAKGPQFYVTCSYEESTIPTVVDYLGEDRVLYASDYWHADAKFPGTVQAIRDIKGLSERAKQKVLCDNAARLFNLNGNGHKAKNRQPAP